MYALKHDLTQRQLGFLMQVNIQQLKLCVPTCSLTFTRPMTKENLIPLSVSLNTEAGMIEKSVFQSEKNRKTNA